MHLGMSFTELQKLPVRYRHWFVKRLSKHFDDRNNPDKNKPKDARSQSETLSRMEEFINKKIG